LIYHLIALYLSAGVLHDKRVEMQMSTQFMGTNAWLQKICNYPMLDHILLYRVEALVLLLTTPGIGFTFLSLVMAIAPTNPAKKAIRIS
jgi:hypothetical protein